MACCCIAAEAGGRAVQQVQSATSPHEPHFNPCRAAAVNAEIATTYTATFLTTGGADTGLPSVTVTPGTNTLSLVGGAYTLRLDATNVHTTGNGQSVTSGLFYVGARGYLHGNLIGYCSRPFTSYRQQPSSNSPCPQAPPSHPPSLLSLVAPAGPPWSCGCQWR